MKLIIINLFIIAFLVACGYAPPVTNTPAPSTGVVQAPLPQYQQAQYPPYPQQPLPPRRDYDDYDDDDDDDDDRKKKKDTCEDDEECEEICDEIFKSGRGETKCGNLDEDEVEDLKDVFEVFEDPDEDSLDDLEEEDLKKFLSISIDPLKKEARRYNSSESEDFLFYIASDEDIAELFEKYDDGFEILEVLLEKLDKDTVKALGEDLSSGGSFFEEALDVNNEVALKWIHEYFTDGTNSYNDSCDGNNDDKCVFDKYCRIAKDLGNSVREDLKDSGFFEDFLEDDVGISDDDYGDACNVSEKDAAASSDVGDRYKYRVQSWDEEVEDKIDNDNDKGFLNKTYYLNPRP